MTKAVVIAIIVALPITGCTTHHRVQPLTPAQVQREVETIQRIRDQIRSVKIHIVSDVPIPGSTNAHFEQDVWATGAPPARRPFRMLAISWKYDVTNVSFVIIASSDLANWTWISTLPGTARTFQTDVTNQLRLFKVGSIPR